MHFTRGKQQGFALPTVVITSVVLFMILVAAVGSVSSARTSLDAQYYQQLARDASESGVNHATSCLAINNYVAKWATAHPLRPNTTCDGGAVCVTPADKCYVVRTPNYVTTYQINSPTDSGGGIQSLKVVGTTSLLRTTGGAAWKTYTYTTVVQSGAQISTGSVVFGYSGNGVFYATVTGDGIMRGAGYNGDGSLGTGNQTSVLTPTKYLAPTTNSIVAGYTNFLSVGFNLFALDNQGNAYGAGQNGYGQIGSGSGSANVLTPQRVNIPLSRLVAYVAPLGYTTYFVTTSGHIYSAGRCEFGMLGSGAAEAGCVNQPNPVLVTLPTPDVADPNTIPTTNLATDRFNAYVRMAGGRVYGWGIGDNGQLGRGNGSRTDAISPIQVGTYGDVGQPRATQVAFDGDTVYILDNTGAVNSVGINNYGQFGNPEATLVNNVSGNCVTAASDGTLSLTACNESAAQTFSYRSDKTFYNALYNKCIETATGGDTTTLVACSGSNYQKYTFIYGGYYQNVQTNGCLDNSGGNGVTFHTYSACSSHPNQVFRFQTTKLKPFDMSSFNGAKIKKIATDQWNVSVLTTAGEVWSAGVNTSGLFGNGTQTLVQSTPVKFPLPNGVTATDLYTTNSGEPSDYQYQNLYVVGSDGRVYGAGSNTYGQLGNGAAITFPVTLTVQTTPVVMNVIDGSTISAISVQAGHGTAVVFASGNRVYAVGNNSSGQLANGGFTNSSTPVLNQFINPSSPIKF